MNSFDIDGVIFINKDLGGVYPGPLDVIITGRSHEEEPETKRMLYSRGIFNQVYYNQIAFDEKTREKSGYHKARTIKKLIESGKTISFHIDDDEIQIAIIRKECPNLNVIHMLHDLTEKENVRHVF